MHRFYKDRAAEASIARLIALLTALWFTSATHAADRVSLLALFKDKAILQIDGARRVLAKGDTSPEGVKLVSADSEGAVIEQGGKRETLLLGVVAGSFHPTQNASVTLFADGSFFFADGSINNVAVRFLVDTGANTVAMNAALAQRIGIDYRKGEMGVATTASGYSRIYRVKLNSVRIGDIELYNIDAGVIEGPQPETPLLGMSFLGGLEMRREGPRMDLIRRH